MCIPSGYPEDEELSESTTEDAEMTFPSTIVPTVIDVDLGINSTTVDKEENQSEILMLLIPLILVAFLILLVILFVIFYKRKGAKPGKEFVSGSNKLLGS